MTLIRYKNNTPLLRCIRIYLVVHFLWLLSFSMCCLPPPSPLSLGTSVHNNCIPFSQESYIEQCTYKNEEACMSKLFISFSIRVSVAYMQELPLCFQTNSTFYTKRTEKWKETWCNIEWTLWKQMIFHATTNPPIAPTTTSVRALDNEIASLRDCPASLRKICTSTTRERCGCFCHWRMMIAKDSYVDSEVLQLDAIRNTLDRLVVDMFFSHHY
jgi:hypothetical protein